MVTVFSLQASTSAVSLVPLMTKDPVLHTLGTRSFTHQQLWEDRRQGVSSVEHFLADVKPREPS